jgi:hypothetical protein
MKHNRALVAMAIAATLATTPPAMAAPKTILKAAGRAVTTVVNTILSGAGIPTKATGIDGDFYIDIKNANLYGPKTKGVWKIATSLKQSDPKSVSNTVGEQVVIGAAGPQGEKGDKGATGNTGAAGSAGSPGAAGAKGASGIDGAAGLPGAQGSAGAKGDAGAAGASGSTGSPGSAGAKGDAGTAGAKGDTGTTGAKGDAGTAGAKGDTGTTGAKGDTGTTGAAGVSVSYYVDLGSWSIATGTPATPSESGSFGSLVAGTYTYEILVDGVLSPNTTAPMTIGMNLTSSAGTLDFRVFASDSVANVNGLGNRHIQFLLIGKLVCTGTVTLKLTATDYSGSTGMNQLTFGGRALINKVGSIG